MAEGGVKGDAGELSRIARGLLRYQAYVQTSERLAGVAAIQEVIPVSKVKCRPCKDANGRPVPEVEPVLCFNSKPEEIPLVQAHLNSKLKRTVLIEERKELAL